MLLLTGIFISSFGPNFTLMMKSSSFIGIFSISSTLVSSIAFIESESLFSTIDEIVWLSFEFKSVNDDSPVILWTSSIWVGLESIFDSKMYF